MRYLQQMVNISLAVAMYIQGFTLASIGREFGVSRQRAWQIIKKHYQFIDSISKKIILKEEMASNPRPEEKYIYNELLRRNLEPMYCGYNNTHDLLFKYGSIQIKFRSHPTPHCGRKYFKFNSLIEKEKSDFYIFICGLLNNPNVFIVPQNKIKTDFLWIAESPLTKNTKKFHRLYKNNWSVFKKQFPIGS